MKGTSCQLPWLQLCQLPWLFLSEKPAKVKPKGSLSKAKERGGGRGGWEAVLSTKLGPNGKSEAQGHATVKLSNRLVVPNGEGSFAPLPLGNESMDVWGLQIPVATLKWSLFIYRLVFKIKDLRINRNTFGNQASCKTWKCRIYGPVFRVATPPPPPYGMGPPGPPPGPRPRAPGSCHLRSHPLNSHPDTPAPPPPGQANPQPTINQP